MRVSEFLCVPKRYHQAVETYQRKFPNGFLRFELSEDRTKLLLKGLPGSGFEMFVRLSEISSVECIEKAKPSRKERARFLEEGGWEGGVWEIKITLKNQEKFRWLHHEPPLPRDVKNPVSGFVIDLKVAIDNAKPVPKEMVALGIILAAATAIIFSLFVAFTAAICFFRGDIRDGVSFSIVVVFSVAIAVKLCRTLGG